MKVAVAVDMKQYVGGHNSPVDGCRNAPVIAINVKPINTTQHK